MDLPLWDPPDDQGYFTSSECNYRAGDVRQCGHHCGNAPEQNSSYNNEDNLLCDFCFCYGRDMIEEDALNEKYCLQVLKILTGKADEDIAKLEEDIVMLQCQLAWGDESWSKPCSAALSEKIDHLDVLIQNLKKERTEDHYHLDLQSEQPVELPPTLHDFLNPLLEDYIARQKQTENSITKMSILPTGGFSKENSEASTSQDNKKIEEKECTTIMLETNEAKSQSPEIEERILKNFHQTSNPMVKDSSASCACTCMEKAYSREMEERRHNDKEVNSKAKVTEHGLDQESSVTNFHLKSQDIETESPEIVKVNYMKQATETSKVPKARVNTHVINKNMLYTKPSVKMKREMTKFPEIKYSIGVSNGRTEQGRQTTMVLEHQIQVEQRNEIETHVINQVKPTSSSEPEGQGPQMKWNTNPITVRNSFVKEYTDVGSSATQNWKGQNIIFGKTKDGRDSTIKLINKVCGTSNSTTKQGIDGVRDVERLRIVDLRAIAKNRGMRGYSKLSKAELQKCLGREEAYEQRGSSPANTI